METESLLPPHTDDPPLELSIEKIKELRAAIIPGPWRTHQQGKCCGQIWSEHCPVAEVISGDWGDDYPALKVEQSPSIEATVTIQAVIDQITYGSISKESAIANRVFIAAAPEIVDFLLAEIEKSAASSMVKE